MKFRIPLVVISSFLLLLTSCQTKLDESKESLNSIEPSTQESKSSSKSSESKSSNSSKSNSTEAHEHTYDSKWTYNNQKHWHAATCGHDVKSEENYHDFTEWSIVKEASETEIGEKRRNCKVCDYSESIIIPKVGSLTLKAHEYIKTSELPVIRINTENGIAIDDKSLVISGGSSGFGMGGGTTKYNYVNATISVENCDGYALDEVTGQVKVRGNFTSSYEKKPLRIKFDKKQAMCGINNGNKLKSWVLLAEYADPSYLRNPLAFYFGNSLLGEHGIYCSDYRYVDVYLNGEYNGLYILVEQQQTGKNRVNIPEPVEPDPDKYDLDNLSDEDYALLHNTKTGYLFEYDNYYSQEAELEKFTITYSSIKKLDGSTFGSSGSGQGWGDWPGGGGFPGMGTIGFPGGGMGGSGTGYTIKSDIYYAEQRDFLKKCVQTIWDVMADATQKDHSNLQTNPYHTMDEDGNNVADPTITSSYEAINKIINIDSLIDMYIISEIMEDNDLAWSSFFFSLDMSPEGDHKLTYTAPWDFDNSMGNVQSARSNDALFAMITTSNPWLIPFGRESWFYPLVNERWNQMKLAGLFDGANEMIDYFTDNYVEAYARNFVKWPKTQKMGDGTFKNQKEASGFVKNWFNERITNLTALFEDQIN